MPSITVYCVNPSCPSRHVEGEKVERETWTATWHEPGKWGHNYPPRPGEWSSDIGCPTCGEDGVAIEDEGGIDRREEELGTRCLDCGVVIARDKWISVEMFGQRAGYCPLCGAGQRMPV